MNVYTREPFEGALHRVAAMLDYLGPASSLGPSSIQPYGQFLCFSVFWDLVFVRKMFVVSTKMTRKLFLLSRRLLLAYNFTITFCACLRIWFKHKK